MKQKLTIPEMSIVSMLQNINFELINWNLEPVIGFGMYRKNHLYGHVEIKMYRTQFDEHENYIIWNVPAQNFPNDFDY
jgi:hypothetical protein